MLREIACTFFKFPTASLQVCSFKNLPDLAIDVLIHIIVDDDRRSKEI